MDAETRRRLAAALLDIANGGSRYLSNERCYVLRDAAIAVLAALPAEPPPDLLALVREWQVALNALDCERSAVDHQPDNHFYARVSAAECALLAYPLAAARDAGPAEKD